MQKHGAVMLMALGIGLLLGMVIHAFTFTTPREPALAGNRPDLPQVLKEATDPSPTSPPLDLSSSKQIVEAMLPKAKVGAEKKLPMDPVAQQVRGILREPVTSYQKVSTLMNLARSLPVAQRGFAYAGAAFACASPEFQQLMLPLVWDPSTPADQAQILAGGVVTLPDSVRLPICLTFLKHSAEPVRAVGLAVLSAYFPNVEEAGYPAAVQAYLANPD